MTASDYATRAAVLSVFDVEWLEPRLDDETVDGVADFLMSSCERVIDGAGRARWRLRDDERIPVLRSSARPALLAVLDALPGRPDEPLQHVLEQYLHDALPPLDRLDADGLAGALQLARWFGPDTDLPAPAEVEARLAWESLVAPLRRLLDHGFVGRADLLATLREFVTGTDGSDFMIYGVGGCGKSTAVAQLVRGLARDDTPFAYVNYDRGWLIEGGPWAILDEILRQLALQLPARREEAAALRDEARARRRRMAGGADIASRKSQRRLQVGGDMIETLAAVLGDHDRLVVVLDTFEELQRREVSHSIEMLFFLRTVRRALPGLRVVIAGRGLPPPIGLQHTWRLGQLSPPESAELLRLLTAGSGRHDSELGEIVDLVGGNPLSLRLAADVLSRTGRDPAVLVAVAEGDIQGQLYARLLEHIRDPQLRAIAHPGLVVRRLTPDVIAEVLAEPCGLGPLSAAGAAAIFDALRREATLCEPSPDGDGALIHRQDVRALMLPAIQRESPARTRSIHQAAVRYYARLEGVVNRREELYHRLMLEEDRSTVDLRWDAAAGPDLVAVLDELPVRSRIYLNTRVGGLRLDPALLAAAADDEWVATVAPAARLRLERGLFAEALELLQGRRGADRRSLVPDLEIETLERLDRVGEALELVRVERRSASRRADVAAVRDLTLQEARIHERLGRWEEATALLDRLHAVDRDRHRRGGDTDDDVRIAELVVLTSLLRVARHQGRADDRTAALRAETVDLVEHIPARVLTSSPSLLRDLAAEIGRTSSRALDLALRTLGGAGADKVPGGPLGPVRDAQPFGAQPAEEAADSFAEEADSSFGYLDNG